MLVIPGILSRAEIARFRAALEDAERDGLWGDGRATAGYQAAGVKHNAQLPEHTPLARQLADELLAALERSKPFIAAALPLRVYPPMFNRYAGGQTFGTHVDTAIRQVPGHPARVRADLSATIFLSEPGEYAGGELVAQLGPASLSAKEAAGSLVLYPAGTLHRVEPVTRGIRLAAVLWVQSMVRDEGQRTLLGDLDASVQHLAAAAPGNPALLQLTAVYHNLLRRWADC